MLYEDEEPEEDYPEEMLERQPPEEEDDHNEPSFSFMLDRHPQDTDFKSAPLRPLGHRQPKQRPPATSDLWNQATDEGIALSRERRKVSRHGTSWTDYGRF